MELSFGERLALLSILPKEGDFATYEEIAEARRQLMFNSEERLKHDIKSEVMADGKTRYVWSKEEITDIPLSGFIVNKIKSILAKADADKKITELEYPLYKKFVLPERK